MTEKTSSEDLEPKQPVLRDSESPFFNVKYTCQAGLLLTESVRKGYDVAQLPNGDINVTEVRIVNVHYSWDPKKEKFVKSIQAEYNNI